MEKLIAFDLYRKNEHGGHSPALSLSKNTTGFAVYRAEDVHALLKRCQECLYHPFEPEKVEQLEKEIDSLMESGS